MFHKLKKNKQQAFDLDNLWLDRVCKTQLLGAGRVRKMEVMPQKKKNLCLRTTLKYQRTNRTLSSY